MGSKHRAWHWVSYSSGRSFACHCMIDRDHTGAEDLQLADWQMLVHFSMLDREE